MNWPKILEWQFVARNVIHEYLTKRNPHPGHDGKARVPSTAHFELSVSCEAVLRQAGPLDVPIPSPCKPIAFCVTDGGEQGSGLHVEPNEMLAVV